MWKILTFTTPLYGTFLFILLRLYNLSRIEIEQCAKYQMSVIVYLELPTRYTAFSTDPEVLIHFTTFTNNDEYR